MKTQKLKDCAGKNFIADRFICQKCNEVFTVFSNDKTNSKKKIEFIKKHQNCDE